MIEPDLWLGARLGCPTYRVQVNPGADVLGAEVSAELEQLLAQRAFLYTRVPTANVEVCNNLVEHGFRVVDTSIVFELTEFPVLPPINALSRFATPSDHDAVESIARNGFRYSRFHLDPHISKSTADEIKACWAANYFSGQRGEFMVVAEAEERAVGFVQLLAATNRPLTIDLIAVQENWRGKDIGRAMLEFALTQCPDPLPMRVGTQAANVASIRFYESFGFRMISSAYVLHANGQRGSKEWR